MKKNVQKLLNLVIEVKFCNHHHDPSNCSLMYSYCTIFSKFIATLSYCLHYSGPTILCPVLCTTTIGLKFPGTVKPFDWSCLFFRENKVSQ